MDQQSLMRQGGVALWRQISNTLRDEIRNGVYEPGSRLPTEMELSQRFGVNRHTLRRAVSSLQDEGLIRIEQGRGTFIQENVVDYRIDQRTRFSERISKLGRHAEGRLIKYFQCRPSAEVAEALEIDGLKAVLALTVLRKVDGRPIYLTTHYLPADRFSGIDDAYRNTGSLTAALRHFGVSDYLRKTTTITVRMPDSEEASLLEQPRNQPVMITESTNVDLDRRPVEFAYARAAGGRIQMIFEPELSLPQR